MSARIDGVDWLADRHLQALLAALSAGGEQARIAGGAVRDALIGRAVADIDIAATTTPDETTRRAKAAGFKPIPTGFEHGTVTVVAGRRAYEVTTLRADIETDGRRAKVVFGRDWRQDAERRDFTINSLYAEADGSVVDLVGGVADLEARRIRFIGDPESRIREDFLRILRFFRFFAWYGSGRPDADGVRACARLKEGLDRLSAERVWSELKKLLSSPDPTRAMLWMRQAGVLSRVVPESEKWGIDAIHPLVRAEADLGWRPDPLLRLEAIVPPDPERMEEMAARLKLSNAETERLAAWAGSPSPDSVMTEAGAATLLYTGQSQGIVDRLRIALAGARNRAAESNDALFEAAGFARLLKLAENWSRPVFPLRGADLEALGYKRGRRLGEALKALEAEWIASGFRLDRDGLLARAADRLADDASAEGPPEG